MDVFKGLIFALLLEVIAVELLYIAWMLIQF